MRDKKEIFQKRGRKQVDTQRYLDESNMKIKEWEIKLRNDNLNPQQKMKLRNQISA